MLDRAYSFRGVQAADRHGDAAAPHAVICQRGAAGTAKIPLCDVRAHEGRRAPARPAQVFAPDTRERHEWLTGCPLAHPAMANARVLRRREQLIAHSSALTATSPLARVFLDNGHVVFPMFKSTRCIDLTMWSASTPIASKHWRRSETTCCARKRHMRRSKQHRYSITSSARAMSVGGTVRPSAFAVLRLITSSNLTG